MNIQEVTKEIKRLRREQVETLEAINHPACSSEVKQTLEAKYRKTNKRIIELSILLNQGV